MPWRQQEVVPHRQGCQLFVYDPLIYPVHTYIPYIVEYIGFRDFRDTHPTYIRPYTEYMAYMTLSYTHYIPFVHIRSNIRYDSLAPLFVVLRCARVLCCAVLVGCAALCYACVLCCDLLWCACVLCCDVLRVRAWCVCARLCTFMAGGRGTCGLLCPS